MKQDKPNHKPQKAQPVQVFRQGAIAASVWKRQTPTGYQYLEYSLSRSWKLKNGQREGYSQNFFESSQDALCEVITQACAYIREHQPAQTDSRRDSPESLEQAA